MHQREHVAKTGGAGAPDIAYSAGPWRLEEGELLLIEGNVPVCRFFNIVLWNRYLQTLDYTHRNVSVNRQHFGIDSEKEGYFRVVVGDQKPPEGYVWLDTGGRKSGTVFLRYVFSLENTEDIIPLLPEAPSSSVVSYEDLQQHK
mmetsp:Transcript_22566/g.35092  ORF Transcript_22566/g.35092 Transcript_22566/m.35092 type:complete len:144 (-) Transcript_22566:36-467(-)